MTLPAGDVELEDFIGLLPCLTLRGDDGDELEDSGDAKKAAPLRFSTGLGDFECRVWVSGDRGDGGFFMVDGLFVDDGGFFVVFFMGDDSGGHRFMGGGGHRFMGDHDAIALDR